MDRISHQRRSDNMRRITNKNTQPEMTVRRATYSLGYRYRLHAADLPGTPDLVFRNRKKVIFVHGCFWHQHSKCGAGRVPDSRQFYWLPKLARNVERDNDAIRGLRKLGWKTLVLWECQIGDQVRLRRKIEAFLDEI